MKIKILAATLVSLAASLAQATIYTNDSPTTTGLIPDGNPVGIVSTISLNTDGDTSAINGVQVTLNISGGFNGDLYGYLVNPNGDLSVLLNRVGTGSGSAIQSAFGYSDAGMNVVLSDVGMPLAGSLAGAIHTYQTVGGYDITSGITAWSPDNLNGNFSALYNGSGNGTWTLFLADFTVGNQSQLVSWGLTVSMVPEPSTWSLIGICTLLGGYAMVRRFRHQTV